MAREVPNNSTPILNEIIESLACLRLSCYEFNMLFAIIRKTYGWDKKTDWISLSQLSALTGMRSQHCSRTLKKLLEKNIIIKNELTVGINKKTTTWLPKQVLPKQVLPKQVLPKQDVGTTQTGHLLLPKQVDTKETITKETIQKIDRQSIISNDLIAIMSKRFYGDVRTEADRFENYWNEADKRGRLKWELQKTWDTSRRFITWLDRSNDTERYGEKLYIRLVKEMGIDRFGLKFGPELAQKYYKYSICSI